MTLRDDRNAALEAVKMKSDLRRSRLSFTLRAVKDLRKTVYTNFLKEKFADDLFILDDLNDAKVQLNRVLDMISAQQVEIMQKIAAETGQSWRVLDRNQAMSMIRVKAAQLADNDPDVTKIKVDISNLVQDENNISFSLLSARTSAQIREILSQWLTIE